MNKTYLIIAFIGGAFLWYFLGTKSATDEPLIIGTSTDYPPFQFEEQQEIKGFEIDLIKEIAARLNRETEIRNIPFDKLFDEIQDNNVHVVTAALTETPERAKGILFTPAYLENDPLILVSRNDEPLKAFNNLSENKKIVVDAGSTADQYVSKYDNFTIVRTDNPAAAFQALDDKQVDAYLVANNVAHYYFDLFPSKSYATSDIENLHDNYALAVSKKHPELLAPIAAALENMKKNGTLQNLKKKWSIVE